MPDDNPQRIEIIDVRVPLDSLVWLVLKVWIATAIAAVFVGLAAVLCFLALGELPWRDFR